MLRIRLRRMGTRNRPFYRVVVSDARKVPTSSAIEELGYYDPLPNPATLSINRERIEYWRQRGAQVSDTVRALLAKPETVAPAEAAAPTPAASPAPAAEAESAGEAPAN